MIKLFIKIYITLTYKKVYFSKINIYIYTNIFLINI